MANIQKQNLRYKKVSSRLDKKVRYDGLNKEEIKLIKAKRDYRDVEKGLNEFWKTAPRINNGAVNWQAMSENELDYFEYINNKSEKLLKQISKLEDELDVDKIMNIFMLLNVHSASY